MFDRGNSFQCSILAEGVFPKEHCEFRSFIGHARSVFSCKDRDDLKRICYPIEKHNKVTGNPTRPSWSFGTRYLSLEIRYSGLCDFPIVLPAGEDCGFSPKGTFGRVSEKKVQGLLTRNIPFGRGKRRTISTRLSFLSE